MNQQNERNAGWLREYLPWIAGAALVLLVLAEAVLRIAVAPTWPPVKTAFDHGDRNCFRPVPDSSVAYRRYGLAGEPVVHSVNRLGFRGHIPDGANDFVVAVVGDDLVYGVGLPESETIPAVLERRLRTRFPDASIRVANLGWPGFNLEEQSLEYERLARELKPDITILLLSDRYSSPSACSNAALPARISLRRFSAVWNQLESALERATFNTATLFSVPAREYPIKVILERLSGHGTDLVYARTFATPPVFQEDGRTMGFDDLAESAGFQILDMTDRFDSSMPGRPPLKDDADLSPWTVKAVVDATAGFVEPIIRNRLQGSTRL